MGFGQQDATGNFWTMNFNMVKSRSCMSACIVLDSPFGPAYHFSFHLEYDGTDNMVKYGSHLHGFELVKEHDIKLLKIIGDFNLVVMQIRKQNSCKNEMLKRYMDVVCLDMEGFIAISLKVVLIAHNQ